MRNILSKFTKSSIISSIALIGFAIMLIAQSEATIIGISYVIGGILVAIGVLAEIQYIKNIKDNVADLDVVYGIVCVILGVLVITHPTAIASVIPLVIGFIIVVNSAIKLQFYDEGNSFVGDKNFVSYEITQRKKYDFQTDVYSLGMLYETTMAIKPPQIQFIIILFLCFHSIKRISTQSILCFFPSSVIFLISKDS